MACWNLHRPVPPWSILIVACQARYIHSHGNGSAQSMQNSSQPPRAFRQSRDLASQAKQGEQKARKKGQSLTRRQHTTLDMLPDLASIVNIVRIRVSQVSIEQTIAPPQGIVVELVDEMPVMAFYSVKAFSEECSIAVASRPCVSKSYACVPVGCLPVTDTTDLAVRLLGSHENIDSTLSRSRQRTLFMRACRRLWMQRLLRLSWLLNLAAWKPSTLMIGVERLLTRIVSVLQVIKSIFEVMHRES
ncbi:glycoside hydrolase family 76 protein, partial [Aureobasidium melanogenum]